MAIALGTDNKKQVRLVVALFAAIGLIGAWEVYTTFSSPSHPSVRPVLAAAKSTSTAHGRTSRSRLDPVLRLDELTRTEQLEYSGNGRDVFSAVLPPVKVEAPIASARPDPAAAVQAVVEPPKPPEMNLKYLGFAIKDKTYTALFTHGDDMFAAKTGDIMFHRFRVGVILPSSVQVTDLTHNITQNISVVASN